MRFPELHCLALGLLFDPEEPGTPRASYFPRKSFRAPILTARNPALLLATLDKTFAGGKNDIDSGGQASGKSRFVYLQEVDKPLYSLPESHWLSCSQMGHCLFPQ